MWEYSYFKSVHNFFDKNRDCYGIVFERYSRTISNVINMRRTTAEIQQVDTAWLTWVDKNNRTETIFKVLDHNVLCVTLKPSSPVLIYEHKFILYDWYSTDSWPIFHQQYSLYWPSVDWYTGQVLAGVLADMYIVEFQCRLLNNPFTWATSTNL